MRYVNKLHQRNNLWKFENDPSKFLVSRRKIKVRELKFLFAQKFLTVPHILLMYLFLIWSLSIFRNYFLKFETFEKFKLILKINKSLDSRADGSKPFIHGKLIRRKLFQFSQGHSVLSRQKYQIQKIIPGLLEIEIF